jgi:uncharacterized protein YjbJ (UPF0337 family)
VTGNDERHAKGGAQQEYGDAKQNEGEAKGYVSGMVDSVTGKAQDVMGAVTGSNSDQLEGELWNIFLALPMV